LSPGDTTDATSPPGRPDTQTTEQQGDDSEGSDKEQDATAGDSGEVTSSTALFTLSVPVDAPVGRPVPLLVSGPKTWSGPLTLMIAGEPRTLGVYRGRGSLALTLGTEETIAISESDGDAETIDVVVSSRSERLLTGSLQGEDLSWGDEADIFLEGVVKVSAGLELSIGPGTRIFMGKDAHLEIAGSLNAVGPVLFTRASEEAWGGLVIGPGGNATLQDAWFVGGGGDDSKAFGHSASQPVVKASSSVLTLTGGGVLDSPGKALGGYKALITLTDFLISRCDTGGEVVQSTLVASKLHVLEIPDADGELDDDDNDGMYFVGIREVDDEIIGSTLTDVVFSVGEDDAIDHNDAELTVTHAWIEGFEHEGVAASGGRTLTVNDTVIQGCDQGIEAGYGDPQVIVRRSLVTGNRVGLRFGDSYSWGDEGSLDVSHSVSVENTEANVMNLTDTGAPKAGAIQITCSMVDDSAFDGIDGNVGGVPDWHADGCVQAPLCDEQALGPDVCE